MEIMMQKGQKLLMGISIVVGVICIELSMYVIPFIEEVKEFEFPMFIVGVILCIISIIFGIRHQKKLRRVEGLGYIHLFNSNRGSLYVRKI